MVVWEVAHLVAMKVSLLCRERLAIAGKFFLPNRYFLAFKLTKKVFEAVSKYHHLSSARHECRLVNFMFHTSSQCYYRDIRVFFSPSIFSDVIT